MQALLMWVLVTLEAARQHLFVFVASERGGSRSVSSPEIRGGPNGTAARSLSSFSFPLLIIIPALLHTHLSPIFPPKM
jgi:hypothetical protein